MAVCEVDGFAIDCGEGHGCGLICTETEEGTECWGFCESEPMFVHMRRRGQGRCALHSDDVSVRFACSELSLAGIQALIRRVRNELPIPSGRKGESISRSATTCTLRALEEQYGISTAAP